MQRVRELGSTEVGGKISMYERPGEVVTLNGVALNPVRYRFVNGQLESIVLSYEGRENRDKLLQWVEERYGKLSPPERRMLSQVEWHGDRTLVTLSFNLSSKAGTLLFSSTSMRRQLFDSNLGGGGMP